MWHDLKNKTTYLYIKKVKSPGYTALVNNFQHSSKETFSNINDVWVSSVNVAKNEKPSHNFVTDKHKPNMNLSA